MGHTTAAQYVIERFIKDQLKNFYSKTIRTMKYIVSIVSSDHACYICLTCHKHLLRNKTPCQAVCNKVEIGDIPQVFQDLRRLEKVLISKRLLLRKLLLCMAKGSFLKSKEI